MDIRGEFPIFDHPVGGKPLVYLDSSASAQRPKAVLDAIQDFNERHNANVHRGVHTLSQEATKLYETARRTLSAFINAPTPEDVIFTKGCTESINLVAAAWGEANLKAGDEILISELEHHSNIVPWQIVAQKTGATIIPFPIKEDCSLDILHLKRLISPRTKIVAVKHLCNATGTINPVKEIAAIAHSVGALCLVDGAQAMAHVPIDVQDIDADFYAGTSHKVYGPMGIGFLYGKNDLLQSMPPYQTGGGMIRSVTFEGTTYAPCPDKFEPGTPNVSGAVGFGAAIKWFSQLDRECLWQEEHDLLMFATEYLQRIPGIRIIGTSSQKAAVLSFVADFAHPHDLGTVLNDFGVAVRTGHHCCMPLMNKLQIPATVRASLGAYNTKNDILTMVEALDRARSLFT